MMEAYRGRKQKLIGRCGREQVQSCGHKPYLKWKQIVGENHSRAVLVVKHASQMALADPIMEAYHGQK